MPQKKQTDDEQYRTLLENMDSVADLPDSRGDNLQLDDDEVAVLDEIYREQPEAEQVNDTTKWDSEQYIRPDREYPILR